MPFYKDMNIGGHREGEPERTWRYWTFKKNVVVAAGETEGFIIVSFLNSCVTQIHFTVPDLDDTDTAELILKDHDGGLTATIYASGEKADESQHVINVERTLVGDIVIEVECSGAQAADRTFVVKMYGYHG